MSFLVECFRFVFSFIFGFYGNGNVMLLFDDRFFVIFFILGLDGNMVLFDNCLFVVLFVLGLNGKNLFFGNVSLLVLGLLWRWSVATFWYDRRRQSVSTFPTVIIRNVFIF